VSKGSNGTLNLSVLVLNKYYTAINVVPARRAFVLLFKESAEVVACQNGGFTSYDAGSWLEFSDLEAVSANGDEGWVHTPSMKVCVPRIIRLLGYSKVPENTVRFSRRNVIARDGGRCQYRDRKFPSRKLTLDHVVPRSLGGPTTWKNVVCACSDRNVKKGGRRPEDAGMTLARQPRIPQRSPILKFRTRNEKYRSWRHFVGGTAPDTRRN